MYNQYVQNNLLDKLYNIINLHDRGKAINFMFKEVLEQLLQAERTNFLEGYEGKNKANGFYERLFKAIDKYIKINIPRDRNGEFKPVTLDLIKRQDEQLRNLAAKLYSKGLTTRDIGEVFDDIYGKELSPTTVSNITKEFEQERSEWLNRPLKEIYYTIYIDALRINVRRNNVEKEAFYIVIGIREDFKREILGVYNLPSESSVGWEEVLKDLKTRGVKNILLVVADGLKGLPNVVKKEFCNAFFQICIVHKKRNILTYVRSKDKKEIAEDLKTVFRVGDAFYTLQMATKEVETFLNKWAKIYPSLRQKLLPEDLEYYFAYLNFPYSIQRMLYTTNWIERLNKSVRRTEKIRNSFPSPDSAMNLICQYLIDKNESFYMKHVITFFKEESKFFEDRVKMNLKLN